MVGAGSTEFDWSKGLQMLETLVPTVIGLSFAWSVGRAIWNMAQRRSQRRRGVPGAAAKAGVALQMPAQEKYWTHTDPNVPDPITDPTFAFLPENIYHDHHSK